MLLMFGVGLHFSLDDLIAGAQDRDHRRPRSHGDRDGRERGDRGAGGAGRSAPGVILGLALSVASTVVRSQGAREARRARDPERPDRPRLADRRGPGRWFSSSSSCRRSRAPRRREAALPAPFSGLAMAIAHDARPGRRLRHRHAGRRPAVLSLDSLAGGEDRLARALHALRRGGGGRRRLRVVGAVRRLVRSRRLLRRHDASRIGPRRIARRRSRCRCATPSRFSSSSRSACSSIRRFSCASRCASSSSSR